MGEQRRLNINSLPQYTQNEIRSWEQPRPAYSRVERREGSSCPLQGDDRQIRHDVNFQHNSHNRYLPEHESRYVSHLNNDGTAENLAPPLLATSNFLNEAMYQPRCLSYPNSSVERGVPAPTLPAPQHVRVDSAQSNMSENILNQQMQLMQEMFRMLSTQNAHMRDQLENRNVLKVKPEKFSGSGASFHSFMAQFENCSLINKWTPQQKLLMLRSSLTGNALSVLWDIRMDRDCTYEDLLEMLQTRYGSKGQAETFRMQLRARKQKRGENLSSLMQDIRKLIAQAYPGQASDVIECIARDAFIDALADRELALQVLAKEPTTLEKAFQIATKLESYSQMVYYSDKHRNKQEVHASVIQSHGARELESDVAIDARFKEMAEAMQQLSIKIDDMKHAKSTAVSEQVNKRKVPADEWKPHTTNALDTIVCYGCGAVGHRKFDCPRTHANTARWRRSEVIPPGGWRGNTRLPISKDDPSTKHVNMAGTDGIGSLYVDLKVNGKMRQCLIDSGSEVSILPDFLVRDLTKRDAERTLLAANGTRISILGEVEVEITAKSVAQKCVFIVSDQIDAVIIGLDHLIKFQCTIDFSKKILHIMGQQLMLYVKPELLHCRRIIVAERQKIPAQAQMDIEVKMVYPNLKMQDRCWITNANMVNKPELLLAHTLVREAADKAFVRIMNMSHTEIELEKGMRLCNAVSVAEVVDESRDSTAHCMRESGDHEIEAQKKIIAEMVKAVDSPGAQDYRDQFKQLLRKYIKAISLGEDDLGRTGLIKHQNRYR